MKNYIINLWVVAISALIIIISLVVGIKPFIDHAKIWLVYVALFFNLARMVCNFIPPPVKHNWIYDLFFATPDKAYRGILYGCVVAVCLYIIMDPK